jgi:hypothetical protein
MASSFINNQQTLLAKLRQYVSGVSHRFLQTPDRSLEQAYQATLKIVSLENKYFQGNKIPTASTSGDHREFFLQTEVGKKLTTARLRLAEFKASSIVLESLNSNHLEKLNFVDSVLARYTPAETVSLENSIPSALVPISVTLASIAKPVTVNLGNVNKPLNLSMTEINTESQLNKTGLWPRSIGRTINKIKQELNPKSEEEVIEKARLSKLKATITVRLLVLLIVIPLLTQLLSKHLIINPIVQQMRSGESTQVFLNAEMEEEAFKELQSYEERLKFKEITHSSPALTEEEREALVEHKVTELTEEFRAKSNSAVSNVFADLFAAVAFGLTLMVRRQDIAVLKSYLDGFVYGLNDSTKAFILILLTDIFVGFHSPHGWEVLLEGLASHLGVAPNHSAISLFIATIPVAMDTCFKYWIFTYFSRISPSALATYKGMNE